MLARLLRKMNLPPKEIRGYRLREVRKRSCYGSISKGQDGQLPVLTRVSVSRAPEIADVCRKRRRDATLCSMVQVSFKPVSLLNGSTTSRHSTNATYICAMEMSGARPGHSVNSVMTDLPNLRFSAHSALNP